MRSVSEEIQHINDKRMMVGIRSWKEEFLILERPCQCEGRKRNNYRNQSEYV
jgi:hypothetical protein